MTELQILERLLNRALPRWKSYLLLAGAVVVIVVVAVAIFWPIHARSVEKHDACLKNLMGIDSAKHQWVFGNSP